MKTSWMKALAVCVMLVLATAACEKKAEQQPAAAPGAQAGGINWMGYDEGMAKAKETGKPVFVDFYTDWCHYCQQLDATTYQDKKVIDMLNNDFVSIKVNAEGSNKVTEGGKQMTEQELAASYQVTGYPTLWFFDRGCKKVGFMPGYESAEQLTAMLSYISSGTCAKGVSFDDYMKTMQGAPAKK